MNKSVKPAKFSGVKEGGIYIHIPFCDHKCVYCDFYSIITDDNISSYPSALFREIEYYRALYGKTHRFSTIFFGGGTPSLMEPEYLSAIMDTLYKNFSFTDDVEVTMETNPGTVDAEKLKKFRSAGINRISIGIQSFHEHELRFMTRIHDAATAIKTVHLAAETGFDNISIDLIFNLPGQTKDMWLHNLDTAMNLPLTHLSAYSLILERGTILNKLVLAKKVVFNDEDHDADLYEFTLEYMRDKGFLQYEVSNFTKPGFECRHNNIYWQYKDYLGFGTSAHSFMEGRRWWNISSLKFYLDAMKEKGIPVAGSEILTNEQMEQEYVMLALRSSGLDLEDFTTRFGEKALTERAGTLEEYIAGGYIIKAKGRYSLTAAGYALCDELLLNL